MARQTKAQTYSDVAATLALATTLYAFLMAVCHGDEPDLWNPRPEPDDVRLPAPCAGVVAFRKIVTADATGDPLQTILEDRRVVLGQAVEEIGYSEYSRIDYISGAFVDAEADKRYYLLAKYEVTAGLYRSVMSGGNDCPGHTFEDALPKTSVSWFEAVEFTRRYTDWLYHHHLDTLPSFQDMPGYVRLPTETEWEYAVRGGLSVSETEFQRNIFSPDGQLKSHAWYNAPESADGELQPVGSIDKPNPLGLFDMLGNASEIVLDSFRLNRAGRQHGQTGGFTAKGGSIDTPEGELRSSLREERSYFSVENKGETRAGTMGFRVAVSGVAMPDLRAINALRTGWTAAGQTRLLPDDPIEALRALSADQPDTPTRQAIDTIRQQVTRELTLRNDLEDRMLQNLLYSLASMQANLLHLLTAYNELTELEGAYREQLSSSRSDMERGEYKGRLAGIEQRKDRAASEFFDIGDVYTELLTQAVTEFSEAQTSEQIRTLYAELLERNRKPLANVIDELSAAIKVNRANRNLSKLQMLENAFGPVRFY